jgi:hypothetical protein
MTQLASNRIVGGNDAGKRVAMDFYPTPPEATVALLNFLHLPSDQRIWEPACGENDMVNVMRVRGYEVIGTDINMGVDFLTAELPDGVDWIITNPPFSAAEGFIRKCIEHKRPFALLLKSQYWHAKKRQEIFQEHPPAYVLPLTWRPNFQFKQKESSSPLMDMIWCVWVPWETTHAIYMPLSKPEMGVTE